MACRRVKNAETFAEHHEFDRLANNPWGLNRLLEILDRVRQLARDRGLRGEHLQQFVLVRIEFHGLCCRANGRPDFIEPELQRDEMSINLNHGRIDRHRLAIGDQRLRRLVTSLQQPPRHEP